MYPSTTRSTSAAETKHGVAGSSASRISMRTGDDRMTGTTKHDFSIVAVDKFIHATRDSGYRGTPSAVSELVDNALQAEATEISITITVDDKQDEHPLVLSVHDNGSGMNAGTMRTALRFGGSTRFNDRSGLGRYGMGLPNSSFSQAKRVTVHSWNSRVGNVLRSHLDLDEIASGMTDEVPKPRRVARPPFVNGQETGTAITWTRCDRLDNRRISTLTRKLMGSLGRRFRYFLWDGVAIDVNREAIRPIDPLFLHPSAKYRGASQFGKTLVYEVARSSKDRSQTGKVEIRFSELPVSAWSGLSNKEKRKQGIATGAGVSVVRAGREVDYGWFFLTGKRRENYDDWWRCEIRFDPNLDEAFGITHTKQQIRPSPHLIEAIAPDIESIARVLNSRVRRAHQAIKITERFSASEERARAKDNMLPPLPRYARPRDERVFAALGKTFATICDGAKPNGPMTEYRLVSAALSETTFFNLARKDGQLVVVLNPEHPFYKIVYGQLLDSDSPHDTAIRSQIDLLLLAAARNEALLEDPKVIEIAEQLRSGWSDTLATFLNA